MGRRAPRQRVVRPRTRPGGSAQPRRRPRSRQHDRRAQAAPEAVSRITSPVADCRAPRYFRATMPFVWLNDRFIEEADASVSLRDTGLLHAAGVFTTMRSYRALVFQRVRHLRRLRESCDELFIPLQYSDDALTAAIDELLRRSDLADARLRLTVTRGAASQD